MAVDRYVAIVHPLVYEQKMTETSINWMIFATWFVGTVHAFSFSFWALKADPSAPCYGVLVLTVACQMLITSYAGGVGV